MEPQFTSTSHKPGHSEDSPKISVSEQQPAFFPAVYAPASVYSGYPYGVPCSAPYPPPVFLTMAQVFPVQPCFAFPAYHVDPRVQCTNVGANGTLCTICAHDTPGHGLAPSQECLMTPGPQSDGTSPEPPASEEASSTQPTTVSSFSSASSTSASSSNTTVNLSSASISQTASETHNALLRCFVPEASARPRSPPGIRTGKRSFNDSRPNDILHGIPQSQTLAYIPRKRPLIPDLFSIPRLTGQSNFNEWDELIQTLLIQMRLYDHIHSSKQKPNICGISPSYPPAVQPTSSKEEKQRSADWWANDACVKMILSMRLSKTIMQMALAWEGGDTAREMYKLLWRMYGPPSSRREERLLGVEKREARTTA